MVKVMNAEDIPQLLIDTTCGEVEQEQTKAEYSNERIAMILARSQQIVRNCDNVITYVEQTQERIMELREGI